MRDEVIRLVPGLWDVQYAIVPPGAQRRARAAPEAVARGVRVVPLPGHAAGVVLPLAVSAWHPTDLQPGERLVTLAPARVPQP